MLGPECRTRSVELWIDGTDGMVITSAGPGVVSVVRRCPDLSPAAWAELIASLPGGERARIGRLLRPQDRHNSATGWSLLHQLAQVAGVTVRRGADGRPRADPPVDVSTREVRHRGRTSRWTPGPTPR